MTHEEKTDRWERYYQRQLGRDSHPLLLDVLDRFGVFQGNAVDLGCGIGIETRVLLDRGWHVLAVDEQPRAIERLLAAIPQAQQPCIRTLISRFEDLPTLPPVDLVYAAFSLPFCQPDGFPALWVNILASLKPGGRFAGQLFGPRDSRAGYAAKTTHTRTEVMRIMHSLEIEYLWEEESDSCRSTGEYAHRHVFHVIARSH